MAGGGIRAAFPAFRYAIAAANGRTFWCASLVVEMEKTMSEQCYSRKKFWSWLINGSDVQTLSKHWLKNKMPEHDAWTQSQQLPGMALIVSDIKSTNRQRFWERLAEQKSRIVKYNVRPFKVKNL